MQRLPEFRQFQRFERNFKAERVERVHNLRCRFDALIARRADNHCACDGNCIAERGDIEIQRAVVVHVFDRRAFKLLGEFREIVAVGNGTKDEEMVVKVGDNVLYGKYAGTEIELDGEKYLIMRQADVLAII